MCLLRCYDSLGVCVGEDGSAKCDISAEALEAEHADEAGRIRYAFSNQRWPRVAMALSWVSLLCICLYPIFLLYRLVEMKCQSHRRLLDAGSTVVLPPVARFRTIELFFHVLSWLTALAWLGVNVYIFLHYLQFSYPVDGYEEYGEYGSAYILHVGLLGYILMPIFQFIACIVASIIRDPRVGKGLRECSKMFSY